MPEPRFHVGQPVTVFGSGKPHRTTIVRIGRKYAYVDQYGREYGGFDLDTGKGPSKYGGGDFIRTDEELAASKRLAAAVDRLAPIRRGTVNWDRFDIEAIEKIADILESYTASPVCCRGESAGFCEGEGGGRG